MDVVYLIKW